MYMEAYMRQQHTAEAIPAVLLCSAVVALSLQLSDNQVRTAYGVHDALQDFGDDEYGSYPEWQVLQLRRYGTGEQVVVHSHLKGHICNMYAQTHDSAGFFNHRKESSLRTLSDAAAERNVLHGVYNVGQHSAAPHLHLQAALFTLEDRTQLISLCCKQ